LNIKSIIVLCSKRNYRIIQLTSTKVQTHKTQSNINAHTGSYSLSVVIQFIPVMHKIKQMHKMKQTTSMKLILATNIP